MRVSLSFLLFLSLGSVFAKQPMEKRQDAAASEFSSAVSQLVSLYIPSSVAASLASVASAHSVSGTDIHQIIESALTATTTPAWISAIPTQYSSNIVSLESKVDELRSAAGVGSISGAPRVTTGTDGVVSTSTPMAVVSGSTTNGIASSAGASSTLLSGTRTATSTSTSGTSPAVGSAGSSSSSSALAAATQGPVAAVVGVLGLLGLVAL